MIKENKKPMTNEQLKSRKNRFVPIIIVVLAIVFWVVFIGVGIEAHSWELSYVQQAEAPYFVVAHNKNYDISENDDFYKFSKPMELEMKAKNGKLVITDKTNNKVYNGTYKFTSWSKRYHYSYKIVIEGKEGIANISSRFNRTLFMSVDGYYLNFRK